MTTGDPLVESPGPEPIPHLEIKEWHKQYGLVAGITTRDFDLGLFGPGRAASVLTHWLELHQAFADRFPHIVVSRQVHGTAVQFHDDATSGWQVSDGFDGHVTSTPGVLLAVTAADCIPVYLAHPASGTVGLLHAGWRGTAQGVLEAGLDALARASKVSPADIIMHCGVGICGSCYEVGPEVIQTVTGRLVRTPEKIDLRAELSARGRRAGVKNVTQSSWCTVHDADRFFSHRHSGGADGRMLAFLGLPAT